jgi:nucleoside-diphosphate-sugar epimerase
MLVAQSEAAEGEPFNLGCDTPLSVREIADRIVRAAGSGRVECVSYPPQARMVEVGDFYCDYRRIRGKLGWQPLVSLEEGLAETIAYYRRFREHYWKGNAS